MDISDPSFRLETISPLLENEVHVCRLDLDALTSNVDQWRRLLSPDEQIRAERYISATTRRSFVLTRGLLRLVLAGYLGAEAEQVTFRPSARDKPELGPPYSDSDIGFNVSHANGVSLLAFSRGRSLGVDVERVRPDLDIDSIARRFFSAHEQRELATLDRLERRVAFFRCWTRKEAYIKATGEGLALPLNQFDVSLVPQDTNALRATRPDRREASRWCIREIHAGTGYVAALCVAGHDWQLRSWPEMISRN